jgi:hypothetical protein
MLLLPFFGNQGLYRPAQTRGIARLGRLDDAKDQIGASHGLSMTARSAPR